MRKSNSSIKSIKFIQRNSPNYKGCRNYITQLLENVYEIYNYSFNEYIDDQMALFLNINNYNFILYIDYDYIELKIKVNNEIKIFCKDTCWIKAIEWCIEKSEVANEL